MSDLLTTPQYINSENRAVVPVGRPTPKCKNGKFAPKQCHGVFCYCVDPDGNKGARSQHYLWTEFSCEDQGRFT